MTCELKPGATKVEDKGVERMTWCGQWHTDSLGTSPIEAREGERPLDCPDCINAKAEAEGG